MPKQLIGNQMQMGQLNSFVLVKNDDGTWDLTSTTITGSLIITTALTVPIIQGSTVASGTLILKSTSNATKGTITLGSLIIDEVNDRVGIGGSPTTILEITKTQNSSTELRITNSDTTSANARAGLRVYSVSNNIFLESYGAANTSVRCGITLGGWANLHNITGPGLLISIAGVNPIVFGTNNVEALRISSAQNILINSANAGTNGVGVLSIKNGTAPTTGPADAVQFYSSDDAAGHTIPSFYCEGTNVVATGQADVASSVRVKMRINGTVRTFLCQ